MSRMVADDELAYVKTGIGADLDTMLVFNLLRTHGRLSPFIDANLRRQNLTASQLNALLLLRTAGADGLLMGEIGRKLVVTKSNVTGLVDRLERQGLVARAQPADRRATRVRLTGAGAKLLRQTAPRHTELLANLTRCLSVREKRTIIRLLTRLRRELRLRGGGSPS
jgi:MarR family 2-MHQ and catechol resistance regulon transcriptional repressor